MDALEILTPLNLVLKSMLFEVSLVNFLDVDEIADVAFDEIFMQTMIFLVFPIFVFIVESLLAERAAEDLMTLLEMFEQVVSTGERSHPICSLICIVAFPAKFAIERQFLVMAPHVELPRSLTPIRFAAQMARIDIVSIFSRHSFVRVVGRKGREGRR